MSTKPIPGLISVVIPTYCRADFLLKTLESVFAQTRQPLDVIVVDDGSPDDTAERLAPLVREGCIHYVRQANAGQAAARNTGAALAKGEYLVFLDHDDCWPRDVLAWQAAALQSDPTIGAVVGDFIPFVDNPPRNTPPPERLVATHGVGGSRLVDWLSVFSLCPAASMGAALLRGSAFRALGGFDPTLWGADDWDFWFRMTKRFRTLREPRLALYYRQSPGSMSCNVARHVENMMRVLERHLREADPAARTALRFYGYSGLWVTYGSRLWAAANAFPGERNWRSTARSLRTLATLMERRLGANLALKPALVRQRRWRVDRDDPVFRAVHQGPQTA